MASAPEAFAQFTALATLALLTLDDEMALWGQADAQAQLQATLALPCAEVAVKRGCCRQPPGRACGAAPGRADSTPGHG